MIGPFNPAGGMPLVGFHSAAQSIKDQKASYIAFRRKMFFKKLQDAFYGRHVFFYQFMVSEIHHMVVDHQDIIDRKSRDDIWIAVRIRAVQKSVVPLCPRKIIDAFSCQSVIRAYRISIQNLCSGIHHILQLLVIWTILISLVHASSQRSLADLPDI